MNATGGLVDISHLELEKNMWEEGIRHYGTTVPLVLLDGRRTELQNTGFTICHWMAGAPVEDRES